MNFLSEGIGDRLMERLAQATQVQIASAFFCPSDSLLDALRSTQNLELIISEEFTINDPYKLERLSKATLRSVPTDHLDGKLHAKVFIVTLVNGDQWVLLGSANLTQQGLFANQEACIELQSSFSDDAHAITEIRKWFRGLFASAQPTDIARAKIIFDQRSRYRLEPRPSKRPAVPPEYWAIKTTSGGANAEEHWPHFLAEGMVAIGWEGLEVDPSRVDDPQLSHSLAKFLDPNKPGSVDFAVRTIRYFINMPIGSIIVVCRGLVPKQTKPVHIYALARVTGPFRADPVEGTRWRFKRDAVIQEIGAALPAATFAQAVQRDSFRQTMHKVSAEVIQHLADQLGVAIEI